MPERHRSKKRQESARSIRNEHRDASLKVNATPRKRDPQSSARESRDIIGLVKGVPGGSIVPEMPLVEEAPRRAQA